MRKYDPANWFWKDASGRVFSSAASAVVASSDAGYLAFLAGGNLPTPWPRDASGQESDSELSAVLAAHGLSFTPGAKLIAYASAKAAALLAVERSYTVADGVSVKCDSSTVTAGNLSGLNAWGGAHPTSSTNWIDAEGTVTPLTGAQAQALALAVASYGQSVWNALAVVVGEIKSAAITTAAGIDSASWPA